MGSSIRPRLTIDIAGQPIQFSQPFVYAFLETEQAPAQFDVMVPTEEVVTLWQGLPPFATFDYIAIMSDIDVHVEFVVNGGEADEYHFTLFCRGGGYAIEVPGGQSYAGQTGTESAFTEGTLREITKINAFNPGTTDAATVSVFLAQEATE